MTFEERMAELGVDLSDLPKSFSGSEVVEAYNDDRCKQELSAAWEWYLLPEVAAGDLMAILLMHENINIAVQYIAHLTDIIDRMETRLVNLTGERDYLLRLYGYDCEECKRYDECRRDGDCCERDLVEDWAGVPEDWRADDD